MMTSKSAHQQGGDQVKPQPKLTIETSDSYTKARWFHFCHRWTIDNFLFRCSVRPIMHESIDSAKFSPSVDESIKFYLQLYPHYQKEPDYISLFLYLWSYSKIQDKSLITKYRMSIIDADGNESHTAVGKIRPFRHGDNNWGFPKFIKRDYLLDRPDFLFPNNTLTIFCEVKCMMDEVELFSSAIDRERFFTFAKEQTLRNFSSLLEDGIYSDMLLCVDGIEFKVHKNILASRSSVFASIFKNSKKPMFRMDVLIEEIEQDLKKEVFEHFLQFIYSGKIAVPVIESRSTELLILADLYDINQLKQVCELSLCSKLSPYNALNMFNFAWEHNCLKLRSKSVECIKANLSYLRQSRNWKIMSTSQPELYEKLHNELTLPKDFNGKRQRSSREDSPF